MTASVGADAALIAFLRLPRHFQAAHTGLRLSHTAICNLPFGFLLPLNLQLAAVKYNLYVYIREIMKARLRKGKNRSSCTRQQGTLSDELNLVRCVLLQPVGKRYP